MHPFRCSQCDNTVFFKNDRCGRCGAALGFVPATRRMLAFGASPADSAAHWPVLGDAGGAPLRPCANRVEHGICNWMLDDGDTEALCRSCRLTRVIPSLAAPGNLQRWRRFEEDKRHLAFTLLGLGLMPQPKLGPDDLEGLDFHLLEDAPGGPPVKTGHDRGTITLNVREADDDQREALRVQLGEYTRTLLGHLRHEVAHFLQYRWIDRSEAALARCREVFGDERADYAAALQRHYAQGPPADWPQHFVSAYASAHPWEDWAETCAHYLLILDAVQTAGAWGLSLHGPASSAPEALELAHAPQVHELVLGQWLPVAQFLNAMNRSLGLRDSYPFLLPPPVVDKMAAVQTLLQPAPLPLPLPLPGAAPQDAAATAGEGAAAPAQS